MVPLFLLLSAGSLQLASAASPAPILFIIQSQPGEFHHSIALTTKNSILNQWAKYVPDHVMEQPKVILSSEVEDSIAYSAWTIFPLVEIMKIQLEAEKSLEWVALLNENTDIDLKNLNEAVEKYQFKPIKEPLFLGRGLKDSKSTIVHHFDDFASSGVVYPDLESGIFLSRKLVLDLWEKLQDEENLSTNKLFPKDFNIDPSYEFAKFVYDNGDGIALTHLDEICAKTSSATKCLTFQRQEYSCLKLSQKERINDVLEDTFVAVKTCSKFHQSRMSVVKKTWSPLLPRVKYFSDVADAEVPTTHLEYTVNTESGHCNKTMAIINRFHKMDSKPSFLILVDDDTILSVARLGQLLACYQGEGPFILGQRYGYMVATGHGYSYITGGGGIIFNRAAVEQLLSLPTSCSCPQPDTPDDMHLGRCARHAEVPLLHSGRMFQARPPDYPSSMLAYRRPVSFHKHWEIDPVKVYQDYFKTSDNKMAGIKEEL